MPSIARPQTFLLTTTAAALAALAFGLLRAPALPAWEFDHPAARAGAAAEAVEPGAAPRARAALALAPYGAPAGQAMDFDLAAEAGTSIRGDGSARQEMNVRLAGTLRFTVLDHREDELVVAVAAPKLAATAVAGPRSARLDGLARSLAEPSLVRLSRRGHILGYRFACRPEHRGWVRGLVAAHIVATPPADAERWSADAADATGVAALDYEVLARQPLRIGKHKRSYRPVRGLAPRVRGTGEGTFDEQLGWLSASRHQENLELEIAEANCKLTMSLAATLAFLRSERAAVDVAADCWTGPWEPAAGSDDAAQVPVAAEYEHDLVAGATAGELCAEIARCTAGGGTQRKELIAARDRLIALLRLRPETVAELRLRLLEPGLGDAAAAVVLSALGAAGTPAAQRVLGELVAAAAVQPARKIAALHAAFQVQDAVPELLGAVRALAADSGADPALAGTGLQLLGALAHPARAGETGGRFADLLQREDSARGRGLVRHWLDALGNTGRGEVIEPIARYLADPDAETRAAAAAALLHVASEEATSLLAAAAVDDPAPRVRAEAVALLAARNDDIAAAALERVLTADAVERVRRAAILALGQQRSTRADADRLLRRAAAADPSAKLRALAADQLARPQ